MEAKVYFEFFACDVKYEMIFVAKMQKIDSKIWNDIFEMMRCKLTLSFKLYTCMHDLSRTHNVSPKHIYASMWHQISLSYVIVLRVVRKS